MEGLRRGLHIDSYRTVSRVDGHNVVVQSGRASGVLAEATKLWFVNLGAYRSDSMAEQHHFGLVAARSAHRPKLQRGGDGFSGLEQIHKDDLHGVDQDPALDDLLPISGNGQWHLGLEPAEAGQDPDDRPDWWVSIDLIKTASPRHIQSHPQSS